MAGSSTNGRTPRSLADRLRHVPWSRVAFMVGLLVIGFALVHLVDRGGTKISQQDAVVIARTRIDFKPEDYQIRFIRRGIPSRGFWVVSFYIRKQVGGYARVTVVLVDAATGRVTEVRRTT